MTPEEVAAVLLPVLIDEYGGTEEDWTGMRSLKRVSQAVAALMPVATETVEGGILRPETGEIESHSQRWMNRFGGRYKRYRRTRTSYADRVTDWEVVDDE